MPAASTATGGAAKRKSTKSKTTKSKTTKSKTTKSKTTKSVKAKSAGDSHTLDYYKKKAKALGIPLSKDGKSKTKKQLSAAVSYYGKK